MISLTPRLKQLAQMVTPGKILADVGTDHAYLPIYLVQAGIIPRAIATDIHRGPFEIAKEKVRSLGLQDQIELRLGDGLKPLAPGEVETVVIAGMGGMTIRKVLEQSPAVVKRLTQLVLQPMTAPEEVRKWLAQNGWRLAGERLVKEEDKYYQVFSAVRGQQSWPSSDQSLIWHLGPELLAQGDAVLLEYMEKLLSAKRNLLLNLEKVDSGAAKARVEQLKQEMEELEELKEKCRLNANKL